MKNGVDKWILFMYRNKSKGAEKPMVTVKATELSQNTNNVTDRIIKSFNFKTKDGEGELLFVLSADEYNRLAETQKKVMLEDGKKSLQAIRERSAANGLDKISMDEIAADIEEYRREKRAK